MAVTGLVIIAIAGERMADTPAPDPASDPGLEAGQELPPEPDGYRVKAYRAPVPASLKGARVVTTARAEKLWREGKTKFIDVLPRTPKPHGLPKGTVWRDKKRDNIPGSIWLPNVGYGRLHASIQDYFARNLKALSGGAPTGSLLFYCLEDCWMSWNAARRAIEMGYSNVSWYPKGTDGWTRAGLPLEKAAPVP